jgi:hypothetical protein
METPSALPSAFAEPERAPGTRAGGPPCPTGAAGCTEALVLARGLQRGWLGCEQRGQARGCTRLRWSLCGGHWLPCAGRPAAASRETRPQAGAEHLSADGADARAEGAGYAISALFSNRVGCVQSDGMPRHAEASLSASMPISRQYGGSNGGKPLRDLKILF